MLSDPAISVALNSTSTLEATVDNKPFALITANSSSLKLWALLTSFLISINLSSISLLASTDFLRASFVCSRITFASLSIFSRALLCSISASLCKRLTAAANSFVRGPSPGLPVE